MIRGGSPTHTRSIYAGLVDDFDGTFKHLQTTPGGHTITLHLEGYRTVTENIYVRPDETVKMKDTMEKPRLF